jgi:hypothetical protein
VPSRRCGGFFDSAYLSDLLDEMRAGDSVERPFVATAAAAVITPLFGALWAVLAEIVHVVASLLGVIDSA